MENTKDEIDEKEDLATAKRDLLMRFIKDQESLQTSAKKHSNNDATFDILDGFTVSKDFARNTHYKGSDNLTDNVPKKTNDYGKRTSMPNKNDTASRREQSYRVMSSKIRRPVNECQRLDRWEQEKLANFGTKEEDIRFKGTLKVDPSLLRSVERPRSSGKHRRRLRSAPSLSLETDARHFIKQGEMNVLERRELIARKISSLSIVVPRETEVEQDRLKQSVTCAQITRPAHFNRTSNVGISSVDVQLLDRKTSYVPFFHLPPIAAPETTSTPSST